MKKIADQNSTKPSNTAESVLKRPTFSWPAARNAKNRIVAPVPMTSDTTTRLVMRGRRKSCSTV